MSDLVLIPFAGRLLALERDVFDAALIAGAQVLAGRQDVAGAISEPLLDSDAAGSAIGVSARLLEDLARSEQIPHHKVGKFTRFRVSEIAAATRIASASEQTNGLSSRSNHLRRVSR